MVGSIVKRGERRPHLYSYKRENGREEKREREKFHI